MNKKKVIAKSLVEKVTIKNQGDIYGTQQHGFVKFKVADLSNIQMLEDAKIAAQEYFPHLENYPKLTKKLDLRTGKYIGQN